MPQDDAQYFLDFSPENLALLSPDDIFQKAESLIQILREDRRLERKPAKTHAPVLGTYFSMWSNTAPAGGITVLGIENNGSISGCKRLSQQELNDRECSPRTHCPDSKTHSKRIPAENESGERDFVIVFQTAYREDRVVTDVSGEAYIRVGDQRRRLTRDEMYELQRDKGEIDFEQEPCGLAWPDAFDTSLVQQFCNAVEAMYKISGHGREEMLQLRHLGRMRDGVFVPNIACALLFSSDPRARFPGCKVRFLRFEGEVERTGKEYNVIKDITIEGPIPRLIVRTADHVGSQLREFSRLGEDQKFYTAPEYPPEAWYEAVVNACVHRSYGLRNMDVFVKMFDNRLVVESPGGFPPFVTPQTIYETSHPRNPHLMSAMFFLDFVKCHAEGTKRMRDSMGRMNLPAPEFRQAEVASGYMSVRVTLRNNKEQRKVWVDADVTRVIDNDIARGLTQDEIRIVNFVAENGSINVSAAHRLLPHVKTWHSVKRLLVGLVRREVLSYEHRTNIARDSKARFVLRTEPRKGAQ